MKYTVLWTPSAQQNLAAVWLGAADRQAVTSASAIIDRVLGQEPSALGEVRFDSVRTLALAPLGVDYEVIEADRLVHVLTAWDTTKAEPE